MIPAQKLELNLELWKEEDREEAQKTLGQFYILNGNENIICYPRNANCHFSAYKGYENSVALILDYGYADTEAAIAGAFSAADKNTPIPEELTNDVTRFFSMDFMEVLNKFHKEYEL